MSSELTGDDLHVLGRLDEDDVGLVGVESGDHGVGGVVDHSTLGKSDVGDLVSDGLGDLGVAESDQDDLVGNGTGAGAALGDSVGTFSENECFHLYVHLSLTARP